MSTLKAPAADQTLRILRLLARARGPLPASIIASQLNLPRSSVYQLLTTMQAHGFVMHLAEEKRYGLGLAAVELSSAYARQEPLVRLGRPLVAALVDSVRESAHLAAPSGNDVLYLIEERAPGKPPLVSDVDVRLPMHATASGMAILAALPRAQVRALYPNKQAFTRRSGALGGIENYLQLRSELDSAVTRGFAVEQGTVTEGFSSVAAPVLDHRDWPVAAVAVTFHEDNVSAERGYAFGEAVRSVAATLSARIHGPARGDAT